MSRHGRGSTADLFQRVAVSDHEATGLARAPVVRSNRRMLTAIYTTRTPRVKGFSNIGDSTVPTLPSQQKVST